MDHILLKISIMLVPALLAVTMHEVAHGFIAEKLGDPTARLLGRLTLNPIKHLDPIGTVALLVFGFGWARPVPVNSNNLRSAKTDMIWVSLAGPSANLILAIASALLLRVLLYIAAIWPESAYLIQFVKPLIFMIAFSIFINIVLFLFNLLPIPPLDGGRILIGLLPEGPSQMLRRIEPFGMLIILFVIFAKVGGQSFWNVVFFPAVFYLVEVLSGPHLNTVQETMGLLFYS